MRRTHAALGSSQSSPQQSSHRPRAGEYDQKSASQRVTADWTSVSRTACRSNFERLMAFGCGGLLLSPLCKLTPGLGEFSGQLLDPRSAEARSSVDEAVMTTRPHLHVLTVSRHRLAPNRAVGRMLRDMVA